MLNWGWQLWPKSKGPILPSEKEGRDCETLRCLTVWSLEIFLSVSGILEKLFDTSLGVCTLWFCPSVRSSCKKMLVIFGMSSQQFWQKWRHIFKDKVLYRNALWTKCWNFILELKDPGHYWYWSKTVFSLGVHYLNICINLKNWKFELNWSSKLRYNNERKNHPCYTKLCAFRCLISRPQILNLRSRNQNRGKLLLSWKLRYFRGSHFSQCFILSTSPHYPLPSKVLCFWVIINSVHCL